MKLRSDRITLNKAASSDIKVVSKVGETWLVETIETAKAAHVAQATAALESEREKLATISQGGADGVSWKEGLAANASWDTLVVHARNTQGLLDQDGVALQRGNAALKKLVTKTSKVLGRFGAVLDSKSCEATIMQARVTLAEALLIDGMLAKENHQSHQLMQQALRDRLKEIAKGMVQQNLIHGAIRTKMNHYINHKGST